jgi:hypothetical protein
LIIFTEGRKGNEETGVGSHQISKQALLLPLMAEIPTTLRDLLFKTKYPKARPAVAPYPRCRAQHPKFIRMAGHRFHFQ